VTAQVVPHQHAGSSRQSIHLAYNDLARLPSDRQVIVAIRANRTQLEDAVLISRIGLYVDRQRRPLGQHRARIDRDRTTWLGYCRC
jgi:hypothetical protein